MIELPEIEFNDEGMLVAVLQELLKWHGFKVIVTGNFDYITYEALYQFKQNHYLTGSTVTDSETWKALFTE